MILSRLVGDRRDVALFIVRIIVGVIFIAHGLMKLQSPTGVAGFAGMLTSMNFPAPMFFAWLVSLVEPIGGLFLVLGIFTRLSALLLSVVMLVAIIKVKWSVGLISARGVGMELDLALLAGLLSVLLQGPGRYSIEGGFKKELS